MKLILLTLLVGSLGSWVGVRLKIPVGAMVGAMAAVLVFNIFTGYAYMPSGFREVTQMAAGAMLGTKIVKKDIYEIKKVFFPAIILVFGMIMLNFMFGFIISRISNLDLVTALFATAPGGLSDMALIADEFGADSPKVALLQLIRIISIIAIFPFMLKYFRSFMYRNNDKLENIHPISEKVAHQNQDDIIYEDKNIEDNKKAERIKERLLLTLCIALFGGIIGVILDIPAGALLISMLAVAIFNILSNKAYFPDSLRFITQMSTGTLIGSRMTGADILSLKDIFIPAVIMIIGMLIFTVTIGYSMHKFCKLDISTALLASTPGGIQEISMIADDFGADAPKVAVLHLCRLVVVISFFPLLLGYVSTYFH